MKYFPPTLCFSSANNGFHDTTRVYMCGVGRARETERLVESGRHGGPRGIRLRFNEHANDRGSSAVQRRPTSVPTCFPRASFTRNCKARTGKKLVSILVNSTVVRVSMLFDACRIVRDEEHHSASSIFSLFLIMETIAAELLLTAISGMGCSIKLYSLLQNLKTLFHAYLTNL